MFRTFLFAAISVIFITNANAETNYEELEVGSVVKGKIVTGSFGRGISLPPGDWLTVTKRSDELEFHYGNTIRKMPRYFFTLFNQNATSSQIPAIVVYFTPDALDINWGNQKCQNKNEKAIIDDFGTTPDSTLYICATTFSNSKFKKTLENAATSKNKFVQFNLSGLTEHSAEIPDDIIETSVYANRFRGIAVGYIFYAKRVADPFSNESYMQYVKDLTHTLGLAVGDVAQNKDSAFALPPEFSVQ